MDFFYPIHIREAVIGEALEAHTEEQRQQELHAAELPRQGIEAGWCGRHRAVQSIRDFSGQLFFLPLLYHCGVMILHLSSVFCTTLAAAVDPWRR